MTQPKTLLSSGQAAKRCDMTKRTFLRCIEGGHIEADALDGAGNPLFSVETIETFKNEKTVVRRTVVVQGVTQ